ncbi:MAG: response regulator [Leptolyngbya sp. DLM2.Bin27]|nr:MAG: response regulator [Leptolyngbya sp. DLM2.Bin27]
MTKHLLIIDDDCFIRDVAQVTLRKAAGWQVTTAASGAEGIAQAQQGAFDAILLDISMPGMDGFTVFERLKADAVTQAMPVILMTARTLPSDLQQFTTMGFAGVIVKPFNPLTVGGQIADFLGWPV